MIDLPIYSPVQEVIHSEINDIRLFIKRDDMIHPFISGNKWRKLKYNLIHARQQNKNHLVTFGGAFSNHILATAFAGQKFGFKTTAFVRGEKVLPLNDTLYFCERFGMNLTFVDRQSYRDKRVLFEKYFSSDESACFIDEGGASEEAINGCAELISELDDNYGHIFVACGTANTLAGLVKGLERTKLNNTIINGIIVHQGTQSLKTYIERVCPDNRLWKLHDEFHLGGYAKTNAEYLKWLGNFREETGILLDPVYTGKMMMGIFKLMHQNYFKKGSKVLAIHTGGIIGGLGIEQKYYL